MIRRKRFSKNTLKLIYRLLVLILILCGILLIIDFFIKTPIVESCEYKANQLGTEIINSAISQSLDECGFSYEDLTTVFRNSDNNISSIESNTINITKLQTSVTDNILNKLKGIENIDVKVPLGTLLGSKLFADFGPDINIRFCTGTKATSKIISSFETAGINQTSHSIILDTNIEITAITCGYNINTIIPNQFIVAETIIVGTVPSSYSKILFENDDFIEDIVK